MKRLYRAFSFLILATLAFTGCDSKEIEPSPSSPPSLGGEWQGELTVGSEKIPLIFRVNDEGEGTLDSPNQGAFGLPITQVVLSGDEVTIMIESLSGEFTGELSSQASVIDGDWKQGGQSLPLTLKKTQSAPQPSWVDDAEPISYLVEEVTFVSVSDQSIKLSGTLTKPGLNEAYPAIILVSGSGPQNRDSELYGHKPFNRLADKLTRAGYAVLRYDDRGVGASSGDFSQATSFDFADDARGAVQYLAGRSDVSSDQIVLMGHSEGALISLIASNRGASVSRLVLVAGPVLPYAEFVIDQVRDISKASGDIGLVTRQKVKAQKQLIADAIEAGPDAIAIEEAVFQRLRKLGVPNDRARKQAAPFGTPWLSTFLFIDPREEMATITVPSLYLWGEKDLQVNAEKNQAAFEALNLGAAAESTVLSGHNHLFQEAETGQISEYASAGTPMSDEFMETVLDWLDRERDE